MRHQKVDLRGIHMGYIFDIRKKLGHDPIILTGAGVVLVNDKKEILLGRRADNGYWAYPA